jgi:hypothetical protein
MNLGSNPVELDLSRNSRRLGSFVFCVAVYLPLKSERILGYPSDFSSCTCRGNEDGGIFGK